MLTTVIMTRNDDTFKSPDAITPRNEQIRPHTVPLLRSLFSMKGLSFNIAPHFMSELPRRQEMDPSMADSIRSLCDIRAGRISDDPYLHF